MATTTTTTTTMATATATDRSGGGVTHDAVVLRHRSASTEGGWGGQDNHKRDSASQQG